MYCLCVNVYCHRVTTQLQLINISYHIVCPALFVWTVHEIRTKKLHGVCARGSHVDIALTKNYRARCTMVSTYSMRIVK